MAVRIALGNDGWTIELQQHKDGCLMAVSFHFWALPSVSTSQQHKDGCLMAVSRMAQEVGVLPLVRAATQGRLPDGRQSDAEVEARWHDEKQQHKDGCLMAVSDRRSRSCRRRQWCSNTRTAA